MTKNIRTKRTLQSCALVAVLAMASLPADAGRSYDRSYDRDQNFVTAVSEFGNGSISGPVRWTRNGRQVRTPGGNWLDCGRSCATTLRLATIDFWQSEQGAGGKDAIATQPGLFGNLGVIFGR